ncbi:hypothetical protein VOM14_19015 [Paraburkholderia sp. MPAMCS5]|uniref:hypothetical protein n=1 Tax=Paraburkholderia sp. MPAMCS5 TaxID=3112563 RepID=UPI002E1729EB|nr:hypothetical protein [Paraburkholderia sp. MPAMCS5]
MNHSTHADSRFHAQPKCQQRPALLTSADRTSSSQSEPSAITRGTRTVCADFWPAVTYPQQVFVDHGNGSHRLAVIVDALLADLLRSDVDTKAFEALLPPEANVSRSTA